MGSADHVLDFICCLGPLLLARETDNGKISGVEGMCALIIYAAHFLAGIAYYVSLMVYPGRNRGYYKTITSKEKESARNENL